MPASPAARAAAPRLTDQLKRGLDAPICLTWEITYGCNLACIHCLSSSGRRDPNELSTAEAMAVIDELHDLQVFYVNIGGGEPPIAVLNVGGVANVTYVDGDALIACDTGPGNALLDDFLRLVRGLGGTAVVRAFWPQRAAIFRCCSGR